MSKADRDNHSNQLNPNNDAYYQSRGYDGRDDYADDDDGEAGGSLAQSSYSPPPRSETEIFLEHHSAMVKSDYAKKLSKQPSMALCDHLRHVVPYFHYRDMGINTAVIIHVVDCDPTSEYAELIRVAAKLWKEECPMKDQLTVFQVEFLKPCQG